MLILPYDSSIPLALAHLAIWGIFVFFAVGTQSLWNPGPSSWFVITSCVSFGSWPLFYLTGKLFFFDTENFLAVCGSYTPDRGFEVDAGTFSLVAIAWSVLRLIFNRGTFDNQFLFLHRFTKELSLQHGLKVGRIALFLGVLGALAHSPRLQISGALAQPLYLIGYLFSGSIAVMILVAPSSGLPFVRYKHVMILIGVTGLSGFLASGIKGVLFINIILMFWFVGSIRQTSRWPTLFALATVGIIFVGTLPAFQRAKLAFSNTRSSDETLKEFTLAAGDLLAGSGSYDETGRKSSTLAIWEYLGIRLCVASSTHQYYKLYGESPRGMESIFFSFRNALPRVIDPNKESSSIYYNELARNSGIGNKEDYETSRKPSYIDECVICWGWYGFFIGGVVLGCYLSIIEWACLQMSRSPEAYRVIRFAMLPLGQLPYFAIIFASAPYTIMFCWIVSTYLLKRVWVDQNFSPKSPRTNWLAYQG